MAERDLVRIARLYYEMGKTQEQIAESEGMSRPTVSRLLDRAVREGIVQISVSYPTTSVPHLEEQLVKQFNLVSAKVVPVYVNHPDAIGNDLGKAVDEYLTEIVRAGDNIGVSWGTTLSYVAKNLTKHSVEGVSIVQLNGGIGRMGLSTDSSHIIEMMKNAFDGIGYLLPVPTIVDSPEIAKTIISDSMVEYILSKANAANIALYGIGRVAKNSVLVKAGYFDNDGYENLEQQGAVGDICSRFFDINGRIANHSLDARTIGVDLESLKTKQHSIAVSFGLEKVQATLGALNGGFMNTLFTDEYMAAAILNAKQDGGSQL